MAYCPAPTNTSWSSSYGYGPDQGNVPITKWQITYNGQTWTQTGANLASTVTTPDNYFRQSCTGDATSATASYWIKLPHLPAR